jgi:CubicO group peptidase (beta-lactamase class C family)
MKNRTILRYFLLTLMSGAAVAQTGDMPLATQPRVATAIQLWQDSIETQMKYRQQPGIAIGIVVDQSLIWAHGFGVSDLASKKPMTPETTFRVASITKSFTATAILQLRDAGKLRLDDPVSKYLPWFTLHNQSSIQTPITVWDLLTHTAGLPRESDFPYWTDDHFPTHDEMIAKLSEQDIVFPPETRWKYSDLGFSIAGEVVAAVSGEPYERYISEHILAPLGMASSGFPATAADIPRLAVGYGRQMPDDSRAKIPFIPARAITPAAGLSSNVDDLARFIMLQFRDGVGEKSSILAAASLRDMHRVQWMQPDWSSADGLGFSIQHSDNLTVVGHGGTFKGYKTNISFAPDLKIGVIVLTNSDDGDPSFYAKQFFQSVAPEIAKVVENHSVARVADPSWSKLVGRYRNSWGDTDVLIVDGSLVMMDPQSTDLRHSFVTLAAISANTFRLVSENGSLPVGELVIFEFAPDSLVARLKVGSNYTYPLRE